MEKLPPVGEDAFKDGFLSKRFGQRIIDRANRPWKVVMPPNAGSAKVMESKENIVLDLSLAKMGVPSSFDGNKMHPWQCYIVRISENGITVKINPVSSLMQTYDYRTVWRNATWKDAWPHVNIDGFTSEFTLTGEDTKVWMEIQFIDGDIQTVKIESGVPGASTWNSDLRYVSSTNSTVDGLGNFTWYQLLAFLKSNANTDGGTEVDVIISGIEYKLVCPTTTHLMQSYIFGVDDASNYASPNAHYAIVPWYGTVFPSS